MSALEELAEEQGNSLYYVTLDVKQSRANLELARKLFGETRNPPYFVIYPVGPQSLREKSRSIVSARVPSEELYDEVIDTLPKKVKYLQDHDLQIFIDREVTSNKAVIIFLGSETFPLWIRIVMNEEKYDKLVVAAQIMHPSEKALQSFGIGSLPSTAVIFDEIGGEPSANAYERARPHVMQYTGRASVDEFREYLEYLISESAYEKEEQRAAQVQSAGGEDRIFKITGQEVFSVFCGNEAKLPCLIAVLDGRKV